MKKSTLFKVAFMAMVAAGVTLSSCKDDDPEPFVKPKLSFEKDSYTVNEADGTIEIKVVLDKPYSEDITIDFELDGTATDSAAVASNIAFDYRILGDQGEVEIKKGEKEGIIEIQIVTDIYLEDANDATAKFDAETIVVSIDKVSSTDIEVTRDDETEISIEQEDGLFVLLQWGEEDKAYTDVDMDLWLWAANTAGTLQLLNFSSARTSFSSPEGFFLPTSALSDRNYGLSCTYYSGTQEPMKFSVAFIEIKDGAEGNVTERAGTYTLANINAYDVTDISPVLVQTFKKTGTSFSDFSEITTPSANSRAGSERFPDGFKRQGTADALPKYLK